jgi:GDPmannose 4,6-dehydratase
MDAQRDWGHAKDYVEMQWLMLQQKQPEDFVIATGTQYSVRQFIEFAAEEIGIRIEWQGKGTDEKGIVAAIEGDKTPGMKVGDVIVRVDPGYFRPAEVETLLGDATSAREKLGWTPKIGIREIVQEMMTYDYAQARRQAILNNIDAAKDSPDLPMP